MMSDLFKYIWFLFFGLIFSLMGTGNLVYSQNHQVTVTAGAFDREGTITSFYLPGEVLPGVYRMRSEAGKLVYVQVDDQNRAWFILDELNSGSSRTYTLIVDPVSSPDSGVYYSSDGNSITFQSADGPVFSYFYSGNKPPEVLDEQYKRGGYIHPVYSPAGTILTNHLDTEMHPHHYGIWSAWTSTRFGEHTPDFWNVHDNAGRVDHGDSLDVVWEGPVHAGFRARNYYVDLSGAEPAIALNEEWEATVYNLGNENYHVFDVELTQTVNTSHPLILSEYHYGGLAFRGHHNWNDPENVSFLTSEGYNRNNGNETRARWSSMMGQVEGNQAGIAMFDHPANPRFPQPVRIHPSIPYFVYTPPQLGEMEIRPGAPYVVRYRYVTYDGDPDPDELNRLWNDFAYPPGVTVTAE